MMILPQSRILQCIVVLATFEITLIRLTLRSTNTARETHRAQRFECHVCLKHTNAIRKTLKSERIYRYIDTFNTYTLLLLSFK